MAQCFCALDDTLEKLHLDQTTHVMRLVDGFQWGPKSPTLQQLQHNGGLPNNWTVSFYRRPDITALVGAFLDDRKYHWTPTELVVGARPSPNGKFGTT